ncbi:hypothetical protein [Prochlorococcus sp. MIT 0604]|uniref:hypothetical protein n=1 Tax=Prochlorococcus sp. MIT 0604 TaxID=1501268 RepID=UPI0004F5A2D7|nr:hypothetical protein [Prochlorococcus sp. MIT 0604]AIQ94736.1 hypothetical protein EW14_0716 [Prochlorococcus sp. MIT 0604]
MSSTRGVNFNILGFQKPYEGPHISRKDAIAKGLTKYFEGKTCRRGHIDFRWVEGGCNACLNERKRDRRRKNVVDPIQGPYILSYGPYLSAKQARDQGLKFYYAGPCFRCGSVVGKKVKKGCVTCTKLSDKKWKDQNQDKVDDYLKKYRSTEKAKNTLKKWTDINADKLREQNRAKEQRARNNLTQRAIATLVRNRVTAVLQGRSKLKSSLELTGVRSWQELRNRIEEQFQEGMSWENWTKEGWHIDHVRPIASFDLNDTEQHKTCFNWRNLQPLLGSENLQKLDKYTEEDEEVWIKRMKDLGFEGELFLKFK